MPKKNYYQLLGVKQDAEEEEIGEAYLKYIDEEDLFAGKGGWRGKGGKTTDKEREKKEKEVVTIVAVLTDPNERKRYDEHLEKFGHDEQFKPIFNAWTDDWSEIIKKVKEWCEEEIEEVEFKWWKSLRKMNKKMRKSLGKETRGWKCENCYQTCEKIIIPSEENSELKLCLICFIYLQGQKAGKKERESVEISAIKLIKAAEKVWEHASPLTLISCAEIIKAIEKGKKK
jgi:hypothetical protein